MESYIKDYLNNKGYVYVKIGNHKSLNKIYQLIKHDNMYNSDNDIELLYLAVYCEINKYYSKAIKLYQMAIDKDHSVAMNNLGNLYYHGKGVQQNYDKAIQLYQMAIDKGLSDAMNNLGLMYYNGQDVQNYDKAIQYFQMAIDKGHSGAMNNLGYIYHNGPGVHLDHYNT
jgi:hypothetical protein